MGWDRRAVADGEGARPQWTLVGMARAALALECSLSDLVEGAEIAKLSFANRADKKSA
jgi:hypothetical protein